jgi:hypothetical protein
MIKKFDTYNESLKGKLKGKELKGVHLEIYNAKEQLETLYLKTNNITTNKGVYSFSITNIKNIEISIHYFHYEEMDNKWNKQYLKDHKDGWNVYITSHNYDKGKKDDYYFTGDWNTILKNIINICYPNVDNIIVNVKDRIESHEIKIEMENRLLNGLENAKKILNDN